jgi:hypothetical protein
MKTAVVLLTLAAAMASPVAAQLPAPAGAQGITASFPFIPVPRTRVRYVQAVPGEVRCSLRFDRTQIIGWLDYGFGSPYHQVTAGTHLVDVVSPNFLATIVPIAPGVFFPGIDYTVLLTGSVSGSPEITTTTVELANYRVPGNQAHVVFIDAVADAPPVDWVVDGSVVASGVPFQGFDPPFSIPPGSHLFEVRVGATPLIGPTRFTVQGGRKHTFVAVGTADATDGFPLTLLRLISD